MIPLRIQLKNFLSYGQEQTINFEPYHLICLSGKNGHGKSALLDAMTWAIWGQARKTSGTAKADSDILRIGQTFMMVTFDFSFNGNTYRIKREYAKTFAKPYASLDFGILDTASQKIKALTDKTIRGTQEKIEKTIGLDYETFINTAFLRQGHANEFSKKSPKERKDVLASILSLNHYEELRKQAQEKVREISSKQQSLVEIQKKLKEELETKQTVLQEFTLVEEQHTILVNQEMNNNQLQKNIQEEQEKLSKKLQEFNVLSFRISQLEELEKKEQEKLRILFAAWRSINRQLRHFPEKKILEEKKEKIQKILKKEQQKLQIHLELKEAYLNTKEKEQLRTAKIKEEHQKNLHNQQLLIQKLISEREALGKQIQEYQHYTDKIKKELATIAKDTTLLQNKQHEYQKKADPHFEKVFEKRKAHYHMWISRLQHIYNEQKQLTRKKQLTQDTDNPSCPLCEQNLSASRKNFLKAKFSHAEQFYLHSRSRLEHATKNLKEILIKQHTELQLKQEQQKEYQQIIVSIEELEKKHKKYEQELQETSSKCQEILKTIERLEKTTTITTNELQKLEATALEALNKDEHYQQLIQEQKKISAQINQIAYDTHLHQKLAEELKALDYQCLEYEKILKEENRQEQRKEEIFSLIHALKEKKKEKLQLAADQKKFFDLQQKEQHLMFELQQIDQKCKEVQEKKELLLQEKGRLEQQQKHLEQLQSEYLEQEKKIHLLIQDSFEYSAVATALSKNGIQALLIEDAIPEIEHEANILLGQLTDNQTHIIIESVRDLKKGGTRETLDINISDPMGIRAYELFSGGEAFRIDFALRIAISKLLARRAGTSLQTLIIDEGFGSQDEEGLSRLMDALYKIQDNFFKVIIVSHLPALKEQFPVHFVIAKGPQGSTLQVVEQG